MSALLNEHGDALLAYAGRLTKDRHLAEDVVQEALVRAWQNRDRLHEGLGSVHGWLLRVVKNIVIDRVRARDARPTEVNEPIDDLPVGHDHSDWVATSVTVLEAMLRLSDEHQKVIRELYFNDRSVEDAAAVLGVPAGTVKSRSYYALRQLRTIIRPAAA